MDDNRKSFTYIWKINNFSFFKKSFGIPLLESPVFTVHAMCRSKWSLMLQYISTEIEDTIFCYLYRKSDPGPDKLELAYELSFLSFDGSVIRSEMHLNETFEKVCARIPLAAKRDELFAHQKHLYLPDDTLIIRCRMWKRQGTLSESVKCSVFTRIRTKCVSFAGDIKKFSSIKINSKSNVYVESSEKELQFPSIYLCVSEDGKLDIDILLTDYNPFKTYKFKAFILDVYRNKVKSCDEKICNSRWFRIPLFFSKKHLTQSKELYLPSDVLTLHFEFITGNSKINYELEIIDSMVYQYDCQDIQAVPTKQSDTSPSSEEQHTETLPTLRDDIISLYREGILSDTKLKTATETFPAHKAVLSARSPVFKSMFATDMREKNNSCVDIEDLNADTVRQMLLFMYSDTLDGLDYERAKSLYFASDKYNIVSLRHRCLQSLKQNMLHSNCCDILLLADRHQDKDLKNSVQDCIAENDEAVFSSDQWKNLMESHPRLTTEVVLAVYMKNRRT